MDEATRLVASLYGVTDDRKSHYLVKQETFQSGLLSILKQIKAPKGLIATGKFQMI